MAVYKRRGARGDRLERTQISLSKEERELVQKMADQEGVSMSHVMREALREYCAKADSKDPWNRLLDIVGTIDTGDPRSSIDHDKVIYG